MNIVQLLVRTALTYPDHPAVLHGTTTVCHYAQLGERAARLAGYFRNTLALQPGDAVAIYMTNHVAYLEVLYGAWWAGLVVVPINAKLHLKELEFIVSDSQARVLFATDDLVSDTDAVLEAMPSLGKLLKPDSPDFDASLAAEPLEPTHRQADDLAWLFYTSGTTGRPKGVMQTHGNLYAMTSCYFSDVDSVDAQDAIVYAAPMSHGAGMYNFMFVAKAARHVVPESGGFDPAELVSLAREVGRLCMFAAPTMVKRLVEYIQSSNAAVDGFKTIVYGGGPMYVEDIQLALQVMGPRFVQIYGQGESPMTITALSRDQLGDTTHPDWLLRIASVGVAQMLVKVRVVNAHGIDLPRGITGGIVVRGAPVMAGYWKNPEATAKTLRDGWLWTGDMGAMDGRGFLTLKDRSKDMIISGGSNIYPREVEEVLLRHPGVREVSVIGQTDPEWGEVVVAFVVGTDVSARDLDTLCLEQIARFKRPKHYHFVDELPKNNYGKVLKTTLRDAIQKEQTP